MINNLEGKKGDPGGFGQMHFRYEIRVESSHIENCVSLSIIVSTINL